MTVIEKMEAYIESVGMRGEAHELKASELFELIKQGGTFETVRLAYDYGFADGYREGKEEANKP